MPNYKCNNCGKIFGSKTDLTRHSKKKNPCVFLDNLKEYPAQNIIILKKEEFKIEKNLLKDEPIDLIYQEEIKKIKNIFKNELYLFVFNNLEKNNKFKILYEDTVSKIFDKFESLCQRKLIKINDIEEYKRDYELYDEQNVLKSNEIIKNKLFDIYKDNEKYFCKRLLKYARNLACEIYDVKYLDLED